MYTGTMPSPCSAKAGQHRAGFEPVADGQTAHRDRASGRLVGTVSAESAHHAGWRAPQPSIR